MTSAGPATVSAQVRPRTTALSNGMQWNNAIALLIEKCDEYERKHHTRQFRVGLDKFGRDVFMHASQAYADYRDWFNGYASREGRSDSDGWGALLQLDRNLRLRCAETQSLPACRAVPRCWQQPPTPSTSTPVGSSPRCSARTAVRAALTPIPMACARSPADTSLTAIAAVSPVEARAAALEIIVSSTTRLAVANAHRVPICMSALHAVAPTR